MNEQIEQTSRSLLDRLRTSSSAADWDVFHSIYRPLITRQLRVRHVAAADVDDVTQDILAKVFIGIGSFTHNGRGGAFRNWLGTIISHDVWNYFQKLNRRPITSDLMDLTHPTAEAEIVAAFEAEYDRHVLESLLKVIESEFTATSWQAFKLQTLYARSPAQVALQLEITPNAAIIAKSRVLSRLRQVGAGLLDQL